MERSFKEPPECIRDRVVWMDNSVHHRIARIPALILDCNPHINMDTDVDAKAAYAEQVTPALPLRVSPAFVGYILFVLPPFRVKSRTRRIVRRQFVGVHAWTLQRAHDCAPSIAPHPPPLAQSRCPPPAHGGSVCSARLATSWFHKYDACDVLLYLIP